MNNTGDNTRITSNDAMQSCRQVTQAVNRLNTAMVNCTKSVARTNKRAIAEFHAAAVKYNKGRGVKSLNRFISKTTPQKKCASVKIGRGGYEG